ncbi:MAG: PfkB family carbohydrate kinase [Oscillospiraceae bacterium]|nr:PfkB family carbohydrate kinase [Oscillospiraceae bacterium]
MKREKRKVAVIGALNIDIGGRSAAPFTAGDSIPGQVALSLGGVGWNIARDCALLGAEAAFFAPLGRDEHEAAIRAEAARLAVSLEGCRWVEAPNNRYLYICDHLGDMVAAVNDMRLCAALDAAYVARVAPAVNRCAAAAVDANLSEEALKALGEQITVPLAADCVSAVKCGRLRPLLPRLHTLKANRLEAEALTGLSDPAQALRALLNAGVRRVVGSLGAEGFLCGEGNVTLHQPPLPTSMTDATGAGDCLTAALTVGLAMDLPLAECAALGARAAAVTIAHPGAVTEALRQVWEEE